MIWLVCGIIGLILFLAVCVAIVEYACNTSQDYEAMDRRAKEFEFRKLQEYYQDKENS